MNPDEVPVQTDGVGGFFADLAALVYHSEDYQEIYRAICEAAPALVSGCDHASLMLRQNGHQVSAASSDDIARQIDTAERELGTGPCVDAINDGTPHIDADLTQARLWPALSARVVRTTPVRGLAGFRILIDERKVGALNFFADTPGALTDRSINEAAVLAAFTSVALSAASKRETASTMRKGLNSNREIGKAIGLLMAFHKINDDDAFEMLRRTSQEMNIKIADVADELVKHHRARKA